MFGTVNLPVYFAACVILWITPGTDTVYILSRTVAQGRRAGLLSALAIGGGTVVHTMFAAFGLSAVLATSATAFVAIKIAGAAYLIFLGVQALRPGSGSNLQVAAAAPLPPWTIVRQGLITNVLNPKVAIFFLAFLPQFVAADSARGAAPFLFLGAIFVIGGTAWCCALAFIGAAGTRRLRESSRAREIMQKTLGGIYILLGVNLLRQARS